MERTTLGCVDWALAGLLNKQLPPLGVHFCYEGTSDSLACPGMLRVVDLSPVPVVVGYSGTGPRTQGSNTNSALWYVV